MSTQNDLDMETSQELRMLSSVAISCQVAKIVIANSFLQRIIALTSCVCVSVRKRDILFQTLSTVSHATSPSPQFFSKELAQITLVLFTFIYK